MESVQTSPEPSVDTSTVEASAETAEESVDSPVESPEPSGSVTETQEDSTESPDGVQANSEKPDSEFNHESWDGNLDSLPEHLLGPVSFLHRQLEGGYTKKFQSLADERKAFEAARAEATQGQTNWAEEKETLSGELDLYKRLMAGEEDPRISEWEGKHGTLDAEYKKLQGEMQSRLKEYQDFRDAVEADIQKDAEQYATRFRERNAEIFDDDAKRDKFVQIMDSGWGPEEAAKLVGQTPRLLGLATRLREQGTEPSLAIEHATLKLGELVNRKPRPGAKMTSGAESRNNPESIRKDITQANNSREARTMAAREAMNWQAKNRIG